LIQHSRNSASAAGAAIGVVPVGEGQLDMRARRRGLHPAQWPEAERRLLGAAFGRGGRRQHRSQAHDWAEATRKTVVSSYACSIGWLNDCGILDWGLSPIERWPEELIEAYLEHLRDTYAKASVY